jgi:hypothetical protein
MLFEPLLEFDRALGRAFSTSGLCGAFVPPADVVVTADEVKVFMDVPGLTADASISSGSTPARPSPRSRNGSSSHAPSEATPAPAAS